MSLAQTIVFNEKDNSFDSFVSYTPEAMCSVGNLLVSFKDAVLYTHDGDTYNNFYGVNYPSYITLVFNQNSAEGKTYLSLDERSNVIWTCPEIQTSLISFGSTPQQSSLIETDFELVEGKFVVKFLSDQNSIGGIINGEKLKGFNIKIKFQVTNAQSLITLNQILLNYIDSPLNK